MAKSHVSRTLEWLRDEKMHHDIASSYNHFAKKRKDLFGIIDIVAFRNIFSPLNKDINPPLASNKVIMGIQVCGSDWQPHMRKIKASPFGLDWVEAGELWLIGWRELKSGWKSRMYKFERGDFKSVPSTTLSYLPSSVPDISAL